jgi:sec-independent protein translocase protein TatC
VSEDAPFDFAAEFPFFAFVLREINELRARALWCVGSLVVSAGVLLAFPSWEDSYVLRFSTFLRNQLLPPEAHLVFLSPLEPMAQMIKLSMVLGTVISLPVLVWHFVRFTLPAMSEGLRGFYIRATFLALILLALGIAFSALVLMPMSFKMLISYGSHAGGEAQITFERFYSFITLFLLTFALPFEIPLVMGFLHRFNLVPSAWFRKHRFQAWGVLMLISQFVTPDPIVTPLIFTGMGIVLFESGLWMAYLL